MQTTLTATLIENPTGMEDVLNQLDSVVLLHNAIQRKLYKDIVSYCIKHQVKYLPKEKINSLKQEYQIKYPINARQYNSIYAELMGKITSVLELNKESIADLKDKIKSLEKAIKSKQKSLDLMNKAMSKNIDLLNDKNKSSNKTKILSKPQIISLSNLKTKLFYLNQKLNKNKVKLKNLTQAQETGNPQLCFGSKKLFNQQFQINSSNNLTEFKTISQWKKAWFESRNKSFVLIGSSDETLGNQNCQIKYIGNNKNNNIYELKVNVNPKEPKLKDRTISFQIEVHNDKNNLIQQAILNNLGKDKSKYQALTYRFYKSNGSYKIFISLDKSKQQPKLISSKLIGSIGIDINADHLSVAETDRFGNLIKAFDVQLNLKNKTSHQSLDNMACAVKKITDYAVAKNKPIVIEKLNFSQKKKELKSGYDKQYNLMLSSFAYNKIIQLIKSRSFDKGIEVIEVNPAYTSKIGRYKYQNKYKLTTHQAAAFVIARRGLLSYHKSVKIKPQDIKNKLNNNSNNKNNNYTKNNNINNDNNISSDKTDNENPSIIKTVYIIHKEKRISNQLSKYYPFDLPVRNHQKQSDIYWKEIEQNDLKAKKHRILSKRNKRLILDKHHQHGDLSSERTSVADCFGVYR